MATAFQLVKITGRELKVIRVEKYVRVLMEDMMKSTFYCAAKHSLGNMLLTTWKH